MNLILVSLWSSGSKTKEGVVSSVNTGKKSLALAPFVTSALQSHKFIRRKSTNIKFLFFFFTCYPEDKTYIYQTNQLVFIWKTEKYAHLCVACRSFSSRVCSLLLLVAGGGKTPSISVILTTLYQKCFKTVFSVLQANTLQRWRLTGCFWQMYVLLTAAPPVPWQYIWGWSNVWSVEVTNRMICVCCVCFVSVQNLRVSQFHWPSLSLCFSGQQDRGSGQHRWRHNGCRGQRSVTGSRGGGRERRRVDRTGQPGQLPR